MERKPSDRSSIANTETKDRCKSARCGCSRLNHDRDAPSRTASGNEPTNGFKTNRGCARPVHARRCRGHHCRHVDYERCHADERWIACHCRRGRHRLSGAVSGRADPGLFVRRRSAARARARPDHRRYGIRLSLFRIVLWRRRQAHHFGLKPLIAMLKQHGQRA